MIETISAGPEPMAKRQAQNRDTLLSFFEEHGVGCKRVDRPTLESIVLCFAPLRGSLIEEMPPELRRHTILVDEEGRSYAAEAEGTRDSFGLLGLVEPSAWSNWKSGLYVAWGVFGRENIATRAGLSSFAFEPATFSLGTDVHLQSSHDLEHRFRDIHVSTCLGASLFVARKCELECERFRAAARRS